MLHFIKETAEAIEAVVTLECLKDGKTSVMRGQRKVSIAPRSTIAMPDVELWGAFFDPTYAYRFGPPSHDVTIATLASPAGEVLAQAFHFPLGRAALPPVEAVTVALEKDGRSWQLRLRAPSFTQSVRIEDSGFRPEDDWFHLPPGRDKLIRLRPRAGARAASPRGIIASLFGAPSLTASPHENALAALQHIGRPRLDRLQRPHERRLLRARLQPHRRQAFGGDRP